MSLDERVTALEQGSREVQREFLIHLSENNRHMATLNKVITQQEINSRDVDHNLGMLLGMVTGQEKSIKGMESAIKDIREDVDLRFDVVDGQIVELKQSMEAKFEQVLQQLAMLAEKLK